LETGGIKTGGTILSSPGGIKTGGFIQTKQAELFYVRQAELF
jgi:hypothetical protein